MKKEAITYTPNLGFEEEAQLEYGNPVAGVDEAGRGPWAGPVVAAAVILDIDNVPDGLDDSKKLSAKKRDALFDAVYASARVGVGIADVQRIDEMNILHASLWAMSEALRQLSVDVSAALIDGNKKPDIPCPAITIVKGDSRSLSISAASIVAKVTRDRMMGELAQEFPGYGWERNMGYGVKAHREGLEQHGVTVHHRRSFKPIQALLRQAE